MNKLTKLIWELNQYPPDDINFDSKIVEEFFNVENELLNQLKNGEEISKEDLQYRDSLNKLSHSIHPHLIEIYDIRDHLKRKEDNAHCFNN